MMGRRACAPKGLSPCRFAASPQVDSVGSALLRGPCSAGSVPGLWTGETRDTGGLSTDCGCVFECRAFTYLRWPTSATAIRLEWLSGARVSARAHLHGATIAPGKPCTAATQSVIHTRVVTGDARAQRAQARHREGWRTTKLVSEQPRTLLELKCSSTFVQIHLKQPRVRVCAPLSAISACSACSACAKSPCASPHTTS